MCWIEVYTFSFLNSDDDDADAEMSDGSCNFSCPPRMLELCGQDGVTYKSPCHMKIASCQQGKDIKIHKLGPC